ncbi:MAG: metal ABC transporter permease [Spirochaetia bacterium]|nr:metal ABC transporter permease [Spirochaetia bacterium]
MAEHFDFYSNQILVGSVTGVIVALLGLFLVLRRMTFTGLTFAQACACCLTVATLLEWSQIWLLPMSASVMLPFYSRKSINRESWLLMGYLFFVALTQILISIHANLRQNLVDAYFGNIVTMEAVPLPALAVCGLLFLASYCYSFKAITATSLDPEFAKVAGYQVHRTEIYYYLVLATALAFAVKEMGMVHAVGNLILPGAAAILLARSVPGAAMLAACFSLTATLAGFSASLWSVDSEVNLPTSSVIVLFLCAFYLACFVLGNMRDQWKVEMDI